MVRAVMKETDRPLDLADEINTEYTKTELTTLELRIETCLADIKRNWVEVGLTLAAIRSKRQYKPLSFNKWLRSHKAWKISRQRADQLIRGAKLAKKIDNKCCQNALVANRNGIPNEAVARELSKVPVDHQEHVWKKVTEDATKPTAKKVRQAAAKWIEVPNESNPAAERKKKGTAPKAYRLEVTLAKFVSADAERVREAMKADSLRLNSLGTKLWLTDTPTQVGSALANVASILPKLESPVSVTVRGAK